MTLVAQEGKEYLNYFLFALKTTETKRQYSRNLKLFFDFDLNQNLSLNEQADVFVKKSLNDINWTTRYFIVF